MNLLSYVSRLLGIVVLTAFLFSTAAAQSLFKKKKWWHPDTLASMNLRFLPIPTLSASPETGLKAGLSLDYFYKTSKEKDSTTRASFSWLAVAYSTRKQLNIDGFTSTYTKGEKYFVGFRGGFVNNYERYWGSSSNSEYAELTYNRIFASGRITRNFGSRRFAGLEYYYSKYYNISIDTSKISYSHLLIAPINRSEAIGIGWVFSIDRRDNQFSPSKGMYLDISNTYFSDLNNRSSSWFSINVDARKYFEWSRNVIATQGVLNHLNGNIPLLEQHRLGGSHIMRGFFRGRFRGDNLWALQTEYRYKLSNALKIATFASVGGVAESFDHISKNRVLFSGGTGLRLLFNKAKNIYLGADVALTSTGSFGYYFRIGDAF